MHNDSSQSCRALVVQGWAVKKPMLLALGYLLGLYPHGQDYDAEKGYRWQLSHPAAIIRAMNNKLDPRLTRILEEFKSSMRKGTERLTLLIALSGIPDKAALTRLSSYGLEISSEVGDILTGTIELGKVEGLARDSIIVFIEYSRGLESE